MLSDELVLGADVVVEGDFGKGMRVGCVAWGGGLAVSEEGGDDNEELGCIFNGRARWLSTMVYLLRIQSLVFAD